MSALGPLHGVMTTCIFFCIIVTRMDILLLRSVLVRRRRARAVGIEAYDGGHMPKDRHYVHRAECNHPFSYRTGTRSHGRIRCYVGSLYATSQSPTTALRHIPPVLNVRRMVPHVLIHPDRLYAPIDGLIPPPTNC